VGLATLILGYNSTTHISIEDSVSTIVRGVMVANRQFAEAMEIPLRVGRLEFIELYQDVAISAPTSCAGSGSAWRGRLRFWVAGSRRRRWLECGEGLSPRLAAMSGFSYWSRLLVTDADRHDDLCPPNAARTVPGNRIWKISQPSGASTGKSRPRGRTQTADASATPARTGAPAAVRVSVPARAGRDGRTPAPARSGGNPGRAQHREDDLSGRPVRVPSSAHGAARLQGGGRQAANLVLVVDGLYRNLPWEMLVADEQPMVLTAAMVRQLASTRFRPRVRGAMEKRAYVVGDPSTAGYYTAFPSSGMPDRDRLDPLPGAAQEARAVADLLESQGYQVIEAPPDSEAVDVINKLFKYPYRIVHISAHGVFQAGAGEAAAAAWCCRTGCC